MAIATQSARRGGFVSRRTLAAAASVLAAMALAAAVAGRGCRVDAGTPGGVVASFIEASRADDRETLYQLLGPHTRAWLDDAARRATDLAGGAKRFGPLDMIGISENTHIAPPEKIVVEELSGGEARVELVRPSGQRSELHIVEIDGQWRIELPGYRAPRDPATEKSDRERSSTAIE